MNKCNDCPITNSMPENGCPFGLCRNGELVPILKLLAEAKEVDPLEIEDDENHKGLEQVTFWIRR